MIYEINFEGYVFVISVQIEAILICAAGVVR